MNAMGQRGQIPHPYRQARWFLVFGSLAVLLDLSRTASEGHVTVGNGCAWSVKWVVRSVGVRSGFEMGIVVEGSIDPESVLERVEDIDITI